MSIKKKRSFLYLFFLLSIIHFSVCAQPDSALMRFRALDLQKQYNVAIEFVPQQLSREKWFIPLVLKTAFYSKNYAEMFTAMEKLSTSQKYWEYYYRAAYHARKYQDDSAFLMLQQLLAMRKKPERSKLRTDTVFAKLKVNHRWDSLWSYKYYSDAELKLEMAIRELSVKNYDLALTLLDELVEVRSSLHRALFFRAQLFYVQGFVRSALDDITLALKKYKRAPEYYELSAKILHRMGKQRNALSQIKNAIDLDEHNPQWYRMGTIIANAGEQYEDGLRFSGLYLHAFPDSATALYWHANMIFQTGSCMTALPLINQAIEKQSYVPDYYFLRAQVYQKCKVYAQAEIDYGYCMDFWPTNGVLYLNRGICRYSQKKYKAACKDLNRALNLGALKANALLQEWCR